MSLYVDSSALLKRYIDESDSNVADALICADELLLTARHTIVEVRRNIARLLDGSDATDARASFTNDIKSFSIIELDAPTCEAAATISELTGVRTLDALHLAAVRRAGGTSIPLLTFDLRQAQAARSLGLTVVGA